MTMKHRVHTMPCLSCCLQCRELLFKFGLFGPVVSKRDTTLFTGQEGKSRQEVLPELMVAELAFRPRCLDSQPGALLSTSMNTIDFHSCFVWSL